jgi:uncharacterized protein
VPEGPVIVADTGPVVALAVAEAFPFLRALYGRVVMPTAVWKELQAGAPRPGADLLVANPWVEVLEPSSVPDPLLVESLDAGEASAIQLALQLDAAVLLDEHRGRRLASGVYGLSVIGTLGILARARRAQLVPALTPLLERLVAAGIHLDKALVDAVLRSAGER